MACIEAGKGVILKKGNNLRYIYVTENKREKMDNFVFSCKDMIGKPYGTAFKVLNKDELAVIDPVQVEDHADEYDIGETESADVTKDNRDIHDGANAQKLSKDEIMSLREDGKTTGEEIVEKLIQNSATFQDRTEYSKAKYLKKKKKKYLSHFVALRPCTRLLAEMYYFRNPLKILEVRPDTLAQLLTWSNVQSNSKVLLVDTCQGFIAGSVLERLGLNGNMVQLYQGSFPVRIILEQFNFSTQDVTEKVCSFPLNRIACVQELFHEHENNDDLLPYLFGKPKKDENLLLTQTKNDESLEAMDVDHGQSATNPANNNGAATTEDSHDAGDMRKDKDNFTKKKGNRNDYRKRKLDENETGNESRPSSRVAFIGKEQRAEEALSAMELLRAKTFDSLIIVSKFHPKKILLALLDFIPIACPFVVYSAHQEPLMDCFVTLRERNLAANMEITESWCRSIQVLPRRTHPHITMSGSGGYIFRGVKVQ